MGPFSKRNRPMDILMVEDSLTFARVTMCALKKSDVQHRFTWLQDGEDALDFLYRRKRFARAPRPDVILLDLGLPKRDGREVLMEIKADVELRDIPVVVMTGSTDRSDAVNCERLDVESFMTKPVDLDRFLMLVKELSHCWDDDMLVPAVD